MAEGCGSYAPSPPGGGWTGTAWARRSGRSCHRPEQGRPSGAVARARRSGVLPPRWRGCRIMEWRGCQIMDRRRRPEPPGRMLNAYPLVLSGGLSERQVSVKGALPLLLAGVPALLLLALGIWVALVWNKLVRQHNQVRASWAQVEVQLQRRHDLVPNLVGVVQGYAAHEHAALAEVAEARAGALGATRVA